jgi:uncharacterized protein YbaR (Trm112 family)
MLICPKCKNDNQAMFDTWNHRREQMDVNCQICSHSYVEIHKGIPKENILPKEIRKPANA